MGQTTHKVLQQIISALIRILLNRPVLFLWRFWSVVCSESKFNGTGAGVTADLTSWKLLILSVSCGGKRQHFCDDPGLALCWGILNGVSPRYPVGITFSSLPEQYHHLYLKDGYGRIGMRCHCTFVKLNWLQQWWRAKISPLWCVSMVRSSLKMWQRCTLTYQNSKEE